MKSNVKKMNLWIFQTDSSWYCLRLTMKTMKPIDWKLNRLQLDRKLEGLIISDGKKAKKMIK